MGDVIGGISPLALAGLIITALLAAAAFWWAWRLFRTRPTSRRGGRLAALRHPGLTVLTAALFMLGGVVWQAIAAFSSSAAPHDPYDLRTIEFVSHLVPAAAAEAGQTPAAGETSPAGEPSPAGAGFYAVTRDGLWHLLPDGPWEFKGGGHMNLTSVVPMADGALLAGGGPSPAGGPPGVLLSADGGVTWETVSLGGEAYFRLLAAGPAGSGNANSQSSAGGSSVIYGVQAHQGSVMGPGLYRSFDGGRSWEQASAAGLPGAEDPIIALSADPHRPDSLAAASAGGLWLSEDGGDNWTHVEIPSGEDDGPGGGGVTALVHHPTVPGRLVMYVPGDGGGIMEWEPADGGDPRRLGLSLGDDDAVVALAVDPANPDIMFAATMNKHIYATSRGGRMWEQRALYGLILE